MDKLERGAVKYQGSLNRPRKEPTPKRPGVVRDNRPGVNWHSFETKRILGTVPVEEDGSANFSAPSGKYLYFQLLDENKKMVHYMRSGVIIHPGETNGCIGCHEDRLSAPLKPEQDAHGSKK